MRPARSSLRGERLTRSPEATAAAMASAATATISDVDRRLLGRAGSVTGAPGSSASSARASAAPFSKRRAGSFCSDRVTTAASPGGTAAGNGGGCVFSVACPASISELPGKARLPESSS